MPAWHPGDPWPSSMPGGAASPRWGGYVRLWVRAGLAPGRTHHMGPHAQDRLDAGNVMGGASTAAGRAGTPDRLWVDLSCDVLDLEVSGGANAAQGIFSKADASTCVVTLQDPEGIYDPINPVPPWSYGGQSRLVPGTPVEVFAEVVDGDAGTVTRHYLFTGTADSWGEDWTPNPRRRVAKLVATDATKQFVNLDRPEAAPVGAGDTTAQRIQRIVTYFGWAGTVDAAASSAVTLQATTLAQSAWELLNRTIDDELGSLYITPTGALRWVDRAEWYRTHAPVAILGCQAIVPAAHDVIIDAGPSNLDRQLRNAVYAARSGGTSQSATSPASIGQFGRFEFQRTDLGVETDAQAGEWATVVVQLYAFPQVGLDSVVLRPDVSPRSWEPWAAILGVQYVTDQVRIVWAPPDHPDHVVDIPVRVVGVHHRITRALWEVDWSTLATRSATVTGHVFTMGPHAQDRLDAGYVLA